MQPQLIGLGGKLRSGKDTIADYLVDRYGWVKLNMSDPLNDALLTIDPWIPVSSDTYGIPTSVRRYSKVYEEVGYVEAKKNPEVRRLLQVLGTEVGRKMIDEQVWVNVAIKNIKRLQAEGKSVAITGIRFPNELAMIQTLGGRSWWVERPGLETDAVLARHASETGVSPDRFDTLVMNDGTLDDLYGLVDLSIAVWSHS